MGRALLYLLPLPVTLEFVIERFGGVRYRPWRQVALTLLAAPAFGRGFARYVANPGDRLFWGMVLLFGGGALLSLMCRAPPMPPTPNVAERRPDRGRGQSSASASM